MATIAVGKGPNQLAVSADGHSVWVTLHEADTLAVVDVAERMAKRLGAQDYINKPLNVDDMLARIAHVFNP